MQTKKPLSNDGTIHPDSYGVDPINPRGSKFEPVIGKVEGRDIGNKINWGRNGGYYKQ